MLRWLTERRRRHLLEQPFPAAWDGYIDANVAFVHHLDDARRARLRELVQVFVAEKRWEGCGGLELTDEIKVTIAALACILILGRDHALFEDVESILVYPTTVVRPPRPTMIFQRSAAPVAEAALLGEAHLHGPVILAWDDVVAGGRNPGDARNVVFHELAHKIDMLGGVVDGTPPLPDRAHRATWAEVCSAAYLDLKARTEHGLPTFLRGYGATNEAEFFAVATETFFEQPTQLRDHLPALYAALAEFYNLDLAHPAATAEA